MSKIEARLTEVFDKDGSMQKIEAYRVDTGEHIIDALWDPSEEQTPQTRDEFRRWVTTVLGRKGYEPIN